MSRVVFDDHGPVPLLEPGEWVVCNACGAAFSEATYRLAEGPGRIDLVPADYNEHGGAECPACHEIKGFVRHGSEESRQPDRAMVARWGEAGQSFVGLPRVLIENLPALHLTLSDVGVITLIDSHRWRADDLPFPSVARLAALAGLQEDHLNRHYLVRFESLGYLRRERTRRRSGAYGRTFYDFGGLNAALQKLVERDSPGNPSGSDTLSSSLAGISPESHPGDSTGNYPGYPSEEVEVVIEEEKVGETDSSVNRGAALTRPRHLGAGNE